jgi:hypothetical protein
MGQQPPLQEGEEVESQELERQPLEAEEQKEMTYLVF